MTLKEFILRSLTEIDGTQTNDIDFDIAVQPSIRKLGVIEVVDDNSVTDASRIRFTVSFTPTQKDRNNG